jgi:hypothetical protein
LTAETALRHHNIMTTAISTESATPRRAAELVLLFTGGPALLTLGPRWLVSVGILASGLLCTAVLLRDPPGRGRRVALASTYERSRSTLLVSIEHALSGDVIFTVGVGSLFYSSARWIAR